jgi:hypothetical protein
VKTLQRLGSELLVEIMMVNNSVLLGHAGLDTKHCSKHNKIHNLNKMSLNNMVL